MSEQQMPLDAALLQGDAPPLGPLVRQAFRWYQDSVRARLSARGEPSLTLTQFEIFGHVEWDGTTIAELARRMGITRQAAQQAVRELIQAGLLSLSPDPSSGRSKLVRPTERAANRLVAVREALAEADEQLAARIGPQRMEHFRAALAADWGAPDPDPPRPSGHE